MSFANRRDFIKTLSAAAAVSATNFGSDATVSMAAEDRPASHGFHVNREPLAKNSLLSAAADFHSTQGLASETAGNPSKRIEWTS